MPWTLAGETIHVDDDSDDDAEPIYGRIQILDATSTTLHYVGARSANRTLKFWCETEARMNTLRAAANADANVALVSDLGAEGNYRIMKFSPARRHAVNKTNPWWYCTAELMKR
jgi:hypothetical protein